MADLIVEKLMERMEPKSVIDKTNKVFELLKDQANESVKLFNNYGIESKYMDGKEEDKKEAEKDTFTISVWGDEFRFIKLKGVNYHPKHGSEGRLLCGCIMIYKHLCFNQYEKQWELYCSIHISENDILTSDVIFSDEQHSEATIGPFFKEFILKAFYKKRASWIYRKDIKCKKLYEEDVKSSIVYKIATDKTINEKLGSTQQ